MKSSLDKEKKDKILRQVRALLAKGKDSAVSEKEANSFLAKAQELIDKYNLSETETTVSNDEIVCAFFDSYIDVKNEANSYINREWLGDVAHVISRANLAKVVVYLNSKNHNDEKVYYRRIRFVGTEDNVLYSMELFDFYWRKILKLCKVAYGLSKFRQTSVKGMRLKVLTDYKWIDPQVFYRSYIKGALEGLKEMYEKKTIENYNTNPGYGLIVTNHKNAINVYIEKHVGKLSSHTTIREHLIDDAAYKQGKEEVKNKTRKRLR